ncbi:MAG: phage recombination protein Bet [Methanobrevibacter sp.]|nr:phage recombination protein Bet [Methanobrevibacter sp.]
MAVQNSLKQKKTAIIQNVQTAVYEIEGQKVELSPEVVREYMVSGDKENVTIQEIIMFMNLCKFSGLNPWAKEAYCIKFGKEPATMVIGKEAYIKRAEKNEHFDGFESGIIAFDPETQEVSYRNGTFKLPNEKILGGYARVYRNDRSHPVIAEVEFEEYASRKKDGSLNSMWAKKPGTMIRKVALVQALREAFPSSFGGAFTEEEGGEFVPEIAAEIIAEEQAEDPKAIEQKEKLQKQEVKAKEPVDNEFFS